MEGGLLYCNLGPAKQIDTCILHVFKSCMPFFFLLSSRHSYETEIDMQDMMLSFPLEIVFPSDRCTINFTSP